MPGETIFKPTLEEETEAHRGERFYPVMWPINGSAGI